MTLKLDYFKQKKIAGNIHQYLIQLPNVEFNDTSKAPSIGYKVKNQKYKFATMHGGNSYQSLVLHVNPGNRKTTLGKEIQIEIQKLLGFEISSIRNHCLKTNEVYIPLEKLESSNLINSINHFIQYVYHKQD